MPAFRCAQLKLIHDIDGDAVRHFALRRQHPLADGRGHPSGGEGQVVTESHPQALERRPHADQSPNPQLQLAALLEREGGEVAELGQADQPRLRDQRLVHGQGRELLALGQGRAGLVTHPGVGEVGVLQVEHVAAHVGDLLVLEGRAAQAERLQPRQGPQLREARVGPAGGYVQASQGGEDRQRGQTGRLYVEIRRAQAGQRPHGCDGREVTVVHPVRQRVQYQARESCHGRKGRHRRHG
eukprot:scaffold205466_cov34-Prasinocladus_malaysianus.AAC.1